MRRYFLLIALCLAATVVAQRRFPNVGVGFPQTGDGEKSYAVNVGLLDHADKIHGVQFGVISATAREATDGVNVGGIVAASFGRMNGVQAAGLANYIGGDACGVQLSVALNAAAKRFKGWQVAGLSNYAYDIHGVQTAFFGNVAGPGLRGAQIAGLTNVATNVEKGLQIAGMLNVASGTMRGVQFGTVNFTDTLGGAQIGLLNIGVRHRQGAQIGIINVGGDSTTVRVGLVNVYPSTRVQLLLYLGTSTKFHVAARFRNRRTYSILGGGTHYLGLDKKFSGSLFYRTGVYKRLRKGWSVSGDVGYSHIELFENDLDDVPKRLFALSARMNLDWQCWKKAGLFISAGIEHAREYRRNDAYRTRPIVELGVSLF